MTADMEKRKRMAVFSGSSNLKLADEIAREIGISLGNVKLEKFANGEIYARFDETVRGCDVFFVQSIVGKNVNDLMMETLIVADAAHRASARSVTAVIPHYAYARQDRKAGPREPITARLVANLLECAGVDRVITLDLHQGQIEGFFDVPVNHLTALPLFGQYFMNKNFDWENTVVVSPDVGRAKACKKLSDQLGCDLAIAHKGRPHHNQAEVMGIIGDIKDKTCIINDDMIDTAGTLCAAIRELKQRGVWIFGTAADGAVPLYSADLKGPVAIVIGNEGVGMSRIVADSCDFKVSIPMKGRISSLNASAAAAILLYEAVRQRG